MEYSPENHPELIASLDYLPLPKWAVEYAFAVMDFLELNKSEWANIGRGETSRTAAKQNRLGNDTGRTTISHRKREKKDSISIRKYVVEPHSRQLYEYQWDLLEPQHQDVIVRTYVPGGIKPETVKRTYFSRRD